MLQTFFSKSSKATNFFFWPNWDVKNALTDSKRLHCQIDKAQTPSHLVKLQSSRNTSQNVIYVLVWGLQKNAMDGIVSHDWTGRKTPNTKWWFVYQISHLWYNFHLCPSHFARVWQPAETLTSPRLMPSAAPLELATVSGCRRHALELKHEGRRSWKTTHDWQPHRRQLPSHVIHCRSQCVRVWQQMPSYFTLFKSSDMEALPSLCAKRRASCVVLCGVCQQPRW